ncbi:MAG: hypothetical protein QOJ97_1384 [Solirubrobacteraceae bacterium]|nr:hypothetical protein [Solirubrobacteraceae bacterium]
MRLPLLCGLVLVLAGLAAAPASAADSLFVRAFGAFGADVCTDACQFGDYSAAAGAMRSPSDLAVGGGEVFVADFGNGRIDVYTAAGSFVRAFGGDVNPDAGAPDRGTCTAATGCQAGVAGPGAGQLDTPEAVAVAGGMVYVAERTNHRISVFTTAGAFQYAFGKNVNPDTTAADRSTCTAFTTCQAGTAGTGPGELKSPGAIAVGGGEVYVTGFFDPRVSVFTTAGAYQREFGSGGLGPGELGFPVGLGLDGTDVYVVELGNSRVSLFATSGTFQRAFGRNVNPNTAAPDRSTCDTTTGCQSGVSGPGAGELNAPFRVAVAGGAVHVVESTNNRVSVFTPAGAFQRAYGRQVNPVSGAADPDSCTAVTTCQAGSSGAAGGALGAPSGIALAGGEAYVAEFSNHRVSVFGAAGEFVRAFAKNVGPGSVFNCTAATGCESGARGGFTGQFAYPNGVAVAGGEVFVGEYGNHRVSVHSTGGTLLRAFGRDVNPDETAADRSTCTTATRCQAGATGDGAGQLAFTGGIAVGGGEVYVTELGNARVSVFTPAGAFVRAFGRGVNAGVAPADPDACTAATGCKAGAVGAGAGQLRQAYGIAVGGGEVYVADTNNHRIAVFTPAGAFLRAFGTNVNPDTAAADRSTCTPATGCQAGTRGATAGRLNTPSSVALDGAELYVADFSNHRVVVYTTAGAFVRAFGKDVNPDIAAADRDTCTPATGCQTGSAGGGAGQLSEPDELALGGEEVHVADPDTERISVFTKAGVFVRALGKGVDASPAGTDVCTPATGCQAGSPGGAAGQLEDPAGIGVGAGQVFVADSSNSRVSVFALPRTELSAGPATLAFGERDVAAGPSGDQAATVTNTGTEKVTLTGVTLGGAGAAQFERLTGMGDDCAAATALAAGQACRLRTRFDPAGPGAHAATLTVASDAADVSVALTGTGTVAAVPGAVVTPRRVVTFLGLRGLLPRPHRRYRPRCARRWFVATLAGTRRADVRHVDYRLSRGGRTVRIRRITAWPHSLFVPRPWLATGRLHRLDAGVRLLDGRHFTLTRVVQAC